MRQSQKKNGRDGEEGEEEDSESPGKEEYRQTLLNALARNRSQPRQKGVLSFKSATPSTSGKDTTIPPPHTHIQECIASIHLFTCTHVGSLLNYTSDSLSTSKTNSSLRSSNRRSMKRTAHRIPTAADKILDAPGFIDDYCKYSVFSGQHNVQWIPSIMDTLEIAENVLNTEVSLFQGQFCTQLLSSWRVSLQRSFTVQA